MARGDNCSSFRTVIDWTPPLLETCDMREQVAIECTPVHLVIRLRGPEVNRLPAYVTPGCAVLVGWRGFLSKLELEDFIVGVFAHHASLQSQPQTCRSFLPSTM